MGYRVLDSRTDRGCPHAFWASWPRSSAKRGRMKENIAVDDTRLPVFARALHKVGTDVAKADGVFRRLLTSKCCGTFQRSNYSDEGEILGRSCRCLTKAKQRDDPAIASSAEPSTCSRSHMMQIELHFPTAPFACRGRLAKQNFIEPLSFTMI